jgi:PLP dependent protein
MSKYQDIATYTKAHKVTLIAVSKTKPVEDIMVLYNEGQRVFGENRVQELVAKHEEMPKDIEWHLIGHLQKNKVRYIASFVKMIHSIDSLELLQTIDKEAKKHNRVIDVLLQFHIAQEETKFGLDIEAARAILDHTVQYPMYNIRICGVMGMASFTENQSLIKTEFNTLKAMSNALKKEYQDRHPMMHEVSMGMSGDYVLAISEGSTMVRIGSLLFGKR